jgi:hypothetical protein
MAKSTPAKKPKKVVSKPATKKIAQSAVVQAAPVAKKSNTKRNFVLTTILAALLLLVTNSAVWVNRTMFDTQKFTSVTSQALLSQSSRTALAGEIVDTALQNQPAARAVVAEPATNFIAGLLNTQQAQNALNAVVGKVQILFTSKRPEPITYDLSGIKTTITKLLTLANKDEAVVKVDQVPDSITIFKNIDKIPSFYQAGVILSFMAPLAFLLALLLLVWPHARKKYPTNKLLTAQGIAVTTTALFALLVGPLFKPPVLAQVNDANLRVVVENVYNAFIDTFNHQTYYLLALGIVLLLIPLGTKIYYLIRTTYFDNKKKA